MNNKKKRTTCKKIRKIEETENNMQENKGTENNMQKRAHTEEKKHATKQET